ncbi:uncharacterized protein LOC122950291 [Acropora millepora]|uniref:uncharacterized protein LOC122950291 n=1 Tax=Acropora millepora TaxID=45264 RepID=UPI001CF1C5E3|nr:uncharacterized protein LOC122950291 [Acropora millepora]
MAHQHSSSQPVRRSTRQKSSKKDADPLYSELPGQWQDFNFSDAEFLQPAITKQGAAEAEKSSPSAHRASSATADHIRPSSTRDLELQIRLTEAQNQKLALELEVLRLRRADGSADANTANSCTQPTAAKTRKKRTVDWPHEFAPGNFSSGDYDTLDLPDFVGGFLSMIKSYDAPLESAMLELLELLMAKASSYSWSSVRSFHGYIAKQVELWRLEWTSLSEIREKANTYFKHSDLRSSQLRPTIPSILFSPSVPPSHNPRPPDSSEAAEETEASRSQLHGF